MDKLWLTTPREHITYSLEARIGCHGMKKHRSMGLHGYIESTGEGNSSRRRRNNLSIITGRKENKMGVIL